MSDVEIDLQATVEYIKGEVSAVADSIDFETKVAYQDSLVDVRRAVDEALALLRGEMTKELEAGSRQVGRRVYARVPKRTKAFDHDKIISHVVRQIHGSTPIDTESGVIDHTGDAERAALLMKQLYLSNSTSAKVTELDRLDIPRKDVITSTRSGYEIQVIDTDPEDADE